MRHIKFRWTFKRKEDGHIFQITGDIRALREKNQLKEMFSNDLWEFVGQDQFTGVLDENKHEIYENDIVQFLYEGLFDNRTVRGVVKFKNLAYWIDFPNNGCAVRMDSQIEELHKWAEEDLELLGNTFENPELLEEKQT